MITLYDCATAPSPRRARILLAEKGIAHATVEVDLRRGEQLGHAYRELNPQCTVPALRTDDGLLLTDNAAITAYLEACFPKPPLLGITPQEKAEIARGFVKTVLPLLASGKVRPIIDRIFPMREVEDAHKYLKRGEHFGKIVLTWESSLN